MFRFGPTPALGACRQGFPGGIAVLKPSNDLMDRDAVHVTTGVPPPTFEFEVMWWPRTFFIVGLA